MNTVLACILAYIASQLAIAFWFSRRNRNEEDYLLAGRSLGPWMATFTVFATWFGAESCIGAAGEAYQHGLAGVIADPFGYTIGLVLMGAFFAAALWKRGIVTLADLFRNRYGAGVERLAAVIMIPSSVMWAAAQIRAFGQVLSSASEIGLFFAITLAAAVVIAYTAVGGMWADAVTDLVQGVVLIAGVLALGAMFVAMGGLQAIAQLPAERFSFVHGRTPWDALDTLAVPIFSTIAAQELASRVLAVRSAPLARASTVGAGVMYLAIGAVPVLLGLGASAYIGEGRPAEQVLALFAQQYLSKPLYILFLGALVSAILSTLSGALLVAGSLAAHNLFVHLRPGLSEKARLSANRWAVIGFGIVAYVIALSSESVYGLVQESSSLGSSGILILLLFALWGGRLGGPASGYAALVAGTGTYLVSAHRLQLESPYLVSVAAALAAYLVASLLSTSPSSRMAA
ncbi:MAG TPA: sodium:solute symporter family protein [Candidatus Binatia bacterium]|nr:sodium:solute symporter family protein [Candidatus Binatia bacterium]